MKRLISIFICILLFSLLVSGCSFESLDKDSANNVQQEEESQATSSTMITEEESDTREEKVVLTLYFVDSEAGKLVPEKRFIPKNQMQDLNMSAQTAMKELFKGPIGGNLTSPFPKGVEVPSVKVENSMATVDLTKNFVKKHPGGSSGETLTIFSIVNTLTGINGIKKVQFTVEGKKVPEFKGHLEFDKPFMVNMEIIKE